MNVFILLFFSTMMLEMLIVLPMALVVAVAITILKLSVLGCVCNEKNNYYFLSPHCLFEHTL